eukprot:GHVN01097089.1.p1 GENE.GHVN01097089.1~~GHVN01097089.1.p1  ORF type:complete len:1529 (+),score=359.15 GHVN01097089.1:389-4588(+)
MDAAKSAISSPTKPRTIQSSELSVESVRQDASSDASGAMSLENSLNKLSVFDDDNESNDIKVDGDRSQPHLGMMEDEGAPVRESEGSQDSLPFYYIDAHEDSNTGVVYLFGKVWVSPKSSPQADEAHGDRLITHSIFNRERVTSPQPECVSCCVAIKAHRNVFFKVKLPDTGLPDDPVEANALAKPTLMEVNSLRSSMGISKFMAKPVRRNYAFDREGMTREDDQLFLKIVYSAEYPPMPSDIRGDTFTHVFGQSTSLIELILLKRQIMGPCWLRISGYHVVPITHQKSWCRVEVGVASGKSIRNYNCLKSQRDLTEEEMELDARPRHMDGDLPPPPPLTVSSLKVKTIQNKDGRHEVCYAVSVVRDMCDVDDTSDLKIAVRPTNMFVGIRKRDPSHVWPTGFLDQCKANGVSLFPHEKSLLTVFLSKIQESDPDVIVGHSIYQFELEVLFSRFYTLSLPMWDKLSRLRRSGRLSKPTNTRQGGLWMGRMLTTGRIVCDSYLQARELLRSRTSYTLASLVTDYLPSYPPPPPFNPEDVSMVYNLPAAATQPSKGELMLKGAHCAVSEAVLAIRLAWKIQALPLTRELTCLAGNLWAKSLQNSRAERNEMLLLHRFHEKKFICPDKNYGQGSKGKTLEAPKLSIEKNTAASERRVKTKESQNNDEEVIGAGEGEEGDEEEDENAERGDGDDDGGRQVGKKKGTYSGGLVLEPISGLYDKLILYLDFNSLYPSIIQEYNLCFTTLERPDETESETFEATQVNDKPGVLPNILRSLVERRRQVKHILKSETDARKRAPLEVRQTALKLTANSMYGCLGFSSSRFYVKPLASYITRQGRRLLMSAKSKVENEMRLDVVYGDTDSLMVNTGLSDDGVGNNYAEAVKMANAIKVAVNKEYKRVELDLECVFKRLLLLKKKKYACIKIVDYAKKEYEMENKGLDIVRRDWCGLTRQVGNEVLKILFSDKDIDKVVESLHDLLTSTNELMKNDAVSLDMYVITKGLSKPPQAYSDAKTQPHVQVAKRLIAKGRSVQAGNEIPYVICRHPSTTTSSTTTNSSTTTTSSSTPPDPSSTSAPQRASSTSLMDIESEERKAKSEDSVNGGGGGEGSGGNEVSEVDSGRQQKHFAERAYHPEEVKAMNLKVDIDWYKTQQVLPPIARLCGHVEGTTSGRLAACLGLDQRRFETLIPSSGTGTSRSDPPSIDQILRSEEKFKEVNIDSHKLTCPRCGVPVQVKELLRRMSCSSPSCEKHEFPLPLLLNWVRMFLHSAMSSYSSHAHRCIECGVETHRVCLSQGFKCPQLTCQKKQSLRPIFSSHLLQLNMEYLLFLLDDLTAINESEEQKKQLAFLAATGTKNTTALRNPKIANKETLRTLIEGFMRHSRYNRVRLDVVFAIFTQPNRRRQQR